MWFKKSVRLDGRFELSSFQLQFHSISRHLLAVMQHCRQWQPESNSHFHFVTKFAKESAAAGDQADSCVLFKVKHLKSFTRENLGCFLSGQHKSIQSTFDGMNVVSRPQRGHKSAASFEYIRRNVHPKTAVFLNKLPNLENVICHRSRISAGNGKDSEKYYAKG